MSPVPVSYTHLDVYKRQMHIVDRNIRKFVCYQTSALYLCQIIEPVSYTHLDVYKRQV